MTTKRLEGGLVISRKYGEAIQIGDDILIEVVRRRGSQTQIRIIAPETIPVHRKEVADKILKEASLTFTPMKGDSDELHQHSN